MAAAVVVLGGGLGLWWLTARGPSAQQVAEQYLAALEGGDHEALRELAGDDADDAFDPVAAFGQAAEYLSEPSVGETAVEEDSAVATATATLGGEEVGLRIPLAREGGTWVVHGAAELVASAVPHGALTIGDQRIPSGDTTVSLHPAVYEIVAAPASVLSGSSRVTVVPGDDPVEVSVETQLAEGANAVAQEHLDAYAKTCAEPAEQVPESCGLVVPWGADLATMESIEFQVERTPQIALDADAGAFTATGGVIVATATGTTHEGVPQSFAYRTEDWSLRGIIGFDDARLTLAVF